MVGPVGRSPATQAWDQRNADNEPKTLMEQAIQPMINFWKNTEKYHTIMIAVAAIAALGLAYYIYEKVSPLVAMLEERLIPDYSMAWMGGIRLIINAHELINYLTGVEG